MRRAAIALAVLISASSAHADSVNLPHYSAGDSWTYMSTNAVGTAWRQTRQQLTIDHLAGTSIAVTNATLGAPVPPVSTITNPDWSRSRSVNGHLTVVNQPLNFPLAEGKKWTIDYVENNPSRDHTSEHLRHNFVVVGWEAVTVPAGNFQALKIESNGEWSAALAPTVTGVSGVRTDPRGTTIIAQGDRRPATVTSGRTYKAFWYVPSAKRWVKSIEDYYDSNGVLNRHTQDELESFRLGE